MLQFLTYLLHKQIIEMCRSQNLRCPFSVPSRRLCTLTHNCIIVGQGDQAFFKMVGVLIELYKGISRDNI